MGRFGRVILFALLPIMVLPLQSRAWDRTPAHTFAVLPDGATTPEGITADTKGNIYVTTFGFPEFAGPNGLPGPGQLVVFDSSGKLLRQVSVAGSSGHLLGLRIHPTTGALLVIDFGHAKVLKVDPKTGASMDFMTLPALPHPSLGAGLNDLTFDSDGNVYVSDSFQGVIWRVPSTGGTATPWVESDLLRPSVLDEEPIVDTVLFLGVPPFGANGLRFNNEETALFVANTARETVVKIPVSGTSLIPGTPVVFVNGILGPDGLLIDEDDTLWVAANQADEIVVIDPTGRVIAKLADFQGLTEDGAVKGLLFPASLVFSGGFLYVTNLALDLRLFGFTAVDSQWAAQVTRYTVSRIPKRIPPIEGLSKSDDK